MSRATASRLAKVLVLAAAMRLGAQQPASAPKLAFTFDDLPAHGPLPPGMARPAVVASILKTLKAENMPPTYGFVNGFRMVDWPYQVEILRAWRDAGQPLGNHTWSHPELDKLTAQQYIANIAKNEATLRSVDAQGDWKWFRYPFLEEGDTVAKREAVRAWLKAHGYRVAEVSMDFQDWAWADAYARCAVKKDDAAIAKLHDTYLEAASKSAVAFRTLSQKLYERDVPYILLMHVGAFDARMLPELIAQYRAEGFTFVTLEEASADAAYKLDPKVPTAGGSTFLEQVATARKVNVPELPEYSSMLDKICR